MTKLDIDYILYDHVWSGLFFSYPDILDVEVFCVYSSKYTQTLKFKKEKIPAQKNIVKRVKVKKGVNWCHLNCSNHPIANQAPILGH